MVNFERMHAEYARVRWLGYAHHLTCERAYSSYILSNIGTYITYFNITYNLFHL